jgi:hypothetical protein
MRRKEIQIQFNRLSISSTTSAGSDASVFFFCVASLFDIVQAQGSGIVGAFVVAPSACFTGRATRKKT